ncbi:hypothetical protein OG612_42180 (plasmid) [Streptomyces sp. NBC_01527]|uniref:hypothetical protein n=1 Tax=unclassified Streptomyces TaxID=2593676 RepID=UPI002E0E23A8|nr:hypothetical protein OG763_46035 [Streptomyces sp. NBC_01230]
MTEAAVIEGQAALCREVRDKFTAVNTRLDALGGEVSTLGQKIDGFITEQRSVNATMVERLSGLVGKDITKD